MCTHPEAVESGKGAAVCMACALTALVASDPLRSPALQESAWIDLYVLTNNDKDPRLVRLYYWPEASWPLLLPRAAVLECCTCTDRSTSARRASKQLPQALLYMRTWLTCRAAASD